MKKALDRDIIFCYTYCMYTANNRYKNSYLIHGRININLNSYTITFIVAVTKT